MNQLVSIIVPIYNVQNYLEECVNSLLAQTHKEIEVILVDDESPDNCPQMCEDFAKKDSRIKVIHKKNGGLSSARNAGLDIATGNYIMFIDSDDFVEHNMVEELLAIKAQSNADIVCGGMYRYTNGTAEVIPSTVSKENIEILDNTTALKKLLLRTIDCSSCNKLYSKTFIGETRFKEGRNNEDHPFLFELYQKSCTIAYTNKAYYYYRYNQASITKTFNDRSFDIIKNIDDLEKEIETKKLDIEKEFRLYKSYVYLIIVFLLQKNNCKEKFNSEYNKIVKYIKQNIWYILFNSDIRIKNKIVALLTILKFL